MSGSVALAALENTARATAKSAMAAICVLTWVPSEYVLLLAEEERREKIKK